MEIYGRRISEYFPGVLMVFGFAFPAAGTIILLNRLDLQFSLASIFNLHRTEPLLWLLDFIPVFFFLVAWHVISITRSLESRSIELEKHQKAHAKNIENELSFFDALISNTPFAIVQLDAHHNIISFNPAFEELFGYDGSEIIGKYVDELVASDEYFEEAAGLTHDVTSGKIIKRVGKRKKKDGSLFDAEIIGVPVYQGEERVGVLGIYNDISAQKQIERELVLSEDRFRSLFYDSPISLWEEDFSAVKAHLDALPDDVDTIELLKKDPTLVERCIKLVKILDVNQATIDLYHASSKLDLLAGLPQVLTKDSILPFRNEITALVKGEKTFECEIEQKKFNGEILYGLLRLSVAPGAEDTWDKVFISIVDITERKQAERELRYISFHDTLTSLYNRAYFEEEMSRLERSRQFPVMIVACDLDRLKEINDQFGHDRGDQALRGAAKVLSNAFRNEDVVARIGGDEFVVILPRVEGVDEKTILNRIATEVEAFNQADSVEEGLYRPISISCGAAIAPVGFSLFEAYKRADKEMYLVKVQKRNKTI